tara:strand:+ start:11453 stop:12292 length:840 start_codon:yes stop_codon:yes gene_type:complete
VEKTNKPNLFLVGSPKCGTTFLWNKLKKHPKIFSPKFPEKEINFFSYENLKNDSYYKFYGVSKKDDYLNLFKNSSDENYLMDSSVSYFIDQEAPKKIFKFNSESKIIIMFRDPVQRAFSHHSMDFRMGLASNSISKYLIDSQFKKFYVQYVQNSMYYKYSKNYIDAFPKKQILIIDFNDKKNMCEKISTFLSIDFDKDFFDFSERINSNKVPKNLISKYFQRNRQITTVLKKYLPKKIINKFEPYLYSNKINIERTDEDKKILEGLLIKDWTSFKKMIS